MTRQFGLAHDARLKREGAGYAGLMARLKRQPREGRGREDLRQLRNSPEVVTMHGTSIQDVIARDEPLRFPPPRIDLALEPGAFFYWWALLQFGLKKLPDPRGFPAFPAGTLADDDRRTLSRFVSTAEVLARAELMRDTERSTWKLTRDRGLEVETDFSPPDVIGGLTVFFRQCYGTDPASFRNVWAILRKTTEAEAGLERDNRVVLLDEWLSAEKQLRQKSLEDLLTDRLARQRRLPFPTIEDRVLKKPPNPEELISDYVSGDYVHWDRKAEVVARRAEVPWLDAWHRQRYTEAIIALSHIYVGFSVLIEAAMNSGTP